MHRNSVPHCRILKIWNTNGHWPCQQAEWLCRPCPKWERTWQAWSWWQMVCVGLLPPYSGYKPRKCMCIKTTQISGFFYLFNQSRRKHWAVRDATITRWMSKKLKTVASGSSSSIDLKQHFGHFDCQIVHSDVTEEVADLYKFCQKYI